MKRILIADPNGNTRHALALLLSHKFGLWNIMETGDAETLIRALADFPPDILLLDWQVYGAPAPEMCRLLLKAYPKLRIALLSIHADDAQYALDSGALFIHKGALPEQVLVAIEPLLEDL